MNSIPITPQTIIADLLDSYPQLEDKLIEIAPVFSKLKNPVLRKTIAKVTSLKQAAVVGNIQLSDLINELRKDVGQTSYASEQPESAPGNSSQAEWAKEENAIVYDARAEIQSGVHPLPKIMKEVSELNNDQVYLLITPFVPAPLIEKLEQKGFLVNYLETFPGEVKTFVRKKS